MQFTASQTQFLRDCGVFTPPTNVAKEKFLADVFKMWLDRWPEEQGPDDAYVYERLAHKRAFLERALKWAKVSHSSIIANVDWDEMVRCGPGSFFWETSMDAIRLKFECAQMTMTSGAKGEEPNPLTILSKARKARAYKALRADEERVKAEEAAKVGNPSDVNVNVNVTMNMGKEGEGSKGVATREGGRRGKRTSKSKVTKVVAAQGASAAKKKMKTRRVRNPPLYDADGNRLKMVYDSDGEEVECVLYDTGEGPSSAPLTQGQIEYRRNSTLAAYFNKGVETLVKGVDK